MVRHLMEMENIKYFPNHPRIAEIRKNVYENRDEPTDLLSYGSSTERVQQPFSRLTDQLLDQYTEWEESQTAGSFVQDALYIRNLWGTIFSLMDMVASLSREIPDSIAYDKNDVDHFWNTDK
jgi:hypothetical protein